MTCKRCRKSFEEEEPRCPHCGEPNADATGLFQTSTVLISTGGADNSRRAVIDDRKADGQIAAGRLHQPAVGDIGLK